MKKHSGFTLIELMVVMAIIAILATAGLTAYTGYIKKARDATRIADLAAINTIIQSSSDGQPPEDFAALEVLVKSMNNDVMITDPLDGKQTCLRSEDYGATWFNDICIYEYYTPLDCNGGYMIRAFLESDSNKGLLKPGPSYVNEDNIYYYWLGDCDNS